MTQRRYVNRALHWGHQLREMLNLPKKVAKTCGSFEYSIDLLRGDYRKTKESAAWKGTVFARIAEDYLSAASLILEPDDAKLRATFAEDFEKAGQPLDVGQLRKSWQECMDTMS